MGGTSIADSSVTEASSKANPLRLRGGGESDEEGENGSEAEEEAEQGAEDDGEVKEEESQQVVVGE